MTNIKLVERYSLFFLLLLIPTQLAYHFWPNWTFVFGLRIDLLSPSLYLTDCLIVLLAALSFNKYFQFKKHILAICFFAILNTAFSISPPETFYKWVKLLEFCILALYIKTQTIFKANFVFRVLFYSSFFISIIGIAQVLNGGTIGGLLYWLGERSFNSSTPGIALTSLGGIDYLRAYSIFPHPNALAGYLSIVLISAILNKSINKSLIDTIVFVIILICLLLTFSLSAFLGLVVVFLIYKFSTKKGYISSFTKLILAVSILISMLFPVLANGILNNYKIDNANVGERLQLGYVAGQVIVRSFLIGSGLGTFLINTTEYLGLFTYNWLLQPVHNIFLLIFAETGIFGMGVFSFLLFKYTSNLEGKRRNYLYFVIFIVITGLFDHYWFTLQQNQLLLSLLIGLSLL